MALLSVGVVAACQAPVDDAASSVPSVEPGSQPTPVAPAIQTDNPDAESPIPLPSSPDPVAPAIEVDHPDAERPIPLPTEGP